MASLIYACFVGFYTFAEYLLRTEANKKIKDNYGNIYSYYAAKYQMLLFTQVDNVSNNFSLKSSDICEYDFSSVYA